jgi:hypothetical protein
MSDIFASVPQEPDKFLKWILGVLVVLFFLWLLTGGYDRIENKDKPFIRPPDPLDSGEKYGVE